MIVFIAGAFLFLLVTTTFLLKQFIHHQKKSESERIQKIGSSFFVKKFPSVDLKRYSGITLGSGFIISLLLVITAFEWKHYDEKEVIVLQKDHNPFDELIEIPITEIPVPPKPKIVKPKIVEVSTEVEEDILEEINWENELDESVKDDKVFPGQMEEPEEEKIETEFLIVEDPPTPKGGMKAFNKFLSKHIKYPDQARRMGIEGKVFVEFVVDKDGSLTNIHVVKGIGAGCDEEAIRVLKSAPKWEPGKQRGRPVKVRLTVPISFKFS